MENKAIKTTIEIYWKKSSLPSDEAHDLHITMGLCGFTRQKHVDANGPDLWVREKAGNLESWSWLETLCKRYGAEHFFIRPEYAY